jgi:hypothetical protein
MAAGRSARRRRGLAKGSAASTKTGSLVYCAIPLPRKNGRYARSRSRIRQPSIVVSSVSTIAEQPQLSARETRLATSSFEVLQ